jgi:hypothetical protein
VKLAHIVSIIGTLCASSCALDADDEENCNQCTTSLECVAYVDDCILCICHDGECAVYDLETAPRPIDPTSELPLGRGCALQE